ncbi:transcription initiation factor TFIID subunit 13 isoform X2 [Syngnathoides biaculeatus]|uniref:transcription initiation factor TFIID subunit 13 isoform X2 n=1 Tax=Syngnathoides biaculeatus TaxID=300417 RepID=UPI002ADE66B2|nr:transcription initiation factor TFIID subunit 13 isoform X2 [Syngnathoides biaculeatus]
MGHRRAVLPESSTSPPRRTSCQRTKAGNRLETRGIVLILRPISKMADEEDETGFEEELDETCGGVDLCHGRRKRLFSKELRCMMYGFGDDQNPYTESVDILEDLVIEFITEMTHKAMSIGRQGRVQVEDIVFLIRKDPRKFARVKDLLTMNEELKRARKAFDEANYGS